MPLVGDQAAAAHGLANTRGGENQTVCGVLLNGNIIMTNSQSENFGK